MNTGQVLEKVKDERKRQDRKWGQSNHSPLQWIAILAEEQGEVARAIIDGRTPDYENYEEELIQVAAVCVAAVESLHRTEGREVEK